jgi:hypothetical protein
MWETYQGEGLVVLAIGNGVDEAGCQTWINQWGLTHPVLADPTRLVYPFYGDGFIPYNAIIDGDGVLLFTDSGFNQTLVTNTIEQALLRINHVPMPDSEDDVNPYTVDCSISSVNPLVPGDLVLHWNVDGGATFNEVSLTSVPGDAYTEGYTADIPAQSYGTTVYYYLAAGNTDGRTTTDPANAPTGLHSFYVGVDSTPPVIDHEQLVDHILAQWPVTVSATVTDNQGIDTVTLEFMINGGPTETVPMAFERNGVYSADLYGSVSIGDMIEYRITAVDIAAASNSTVDPASGYHVFFMVEPIPVFIFEPDGTPLSGAAFALELDALGLDYDMGATLPANPSLYRSIFACLGVFSTNHQLTQAEGQELFDFLDLGGRIYMEGGDTWAYDTETAVHPHFNIDGLSDGAGDAGPIQGAVGTLADGMYFQYTGGNSYIDHIAPLGGAEAVFLNVTPPYLNGVAYDGGTYRTVGTSFEFGGLVDATVPSTKGHLLLKILEFFDMDTLIILFEDGFESGDTLAWSATSP